MAKQRDRSTELNELLDTWRASHWPPAGMKAVRPGLNLFAGTHEQLTTLSHSLAEVMLRLEAHVLEVCGGRTPRWMAIPKLVFHVERLNLVQTPAKASKRIPDLVRLRASCGTFEDDAQKRLAEWFAAHPGQELVAHRPFRDIRAFVHVPGKPGMRLRFHESGLAVAAAPGAEVRVQDHRFVIRNARNDAFSDPIAKNAGGWAIFDPSSAIKPR